MAPWLSVTRALRWGRGSIPRYMRRHCMCDSAALWCFINNFIPTRSCCVLCKIRSVMFICNSATTGYEFTEILPNSINPIPTQGPLGAIKYISSAREVNVMNGLPENLIKKLQRVQNTAARLVFNLRKYDRITLALVTLHWLPVKYRIEFKTLLIVFKGLHGKALTYIQEMIIHQKAKDIP